MELDNKIYNNHKKWYTKTISVQEYNMMQQTITKGIVE